MKEQGETGEQPESQELSKDMKDRGRPVKLAEEVRITANRLSTLIAHLPDGIIVETSERTVLQVNQKFCDLFGIDVPPDALQGMDCREAAQQVKHLFKDSEGFVKRIDEILAAGEHVQNEELPLRDGRVFERDYVPMEVAPGQIEHLWHYRDITERKKVEEELRQIQETSHAILEAMPDLIFVLDKDCIFQNYYAANEKDLYVPPQAFVGKNVDEVLPPSLAALTREKANLVLKTGKTQIYEYSLKFESGLRFYESRMVYKSSEQVLAIIREVTERKQAEKALRESESKYRSIFENATEGIYQSTLQGRFITVNPALVKMFGYKNAEEMLAIEDISRLYWDETERKRLVKLANDTGTLTNVEVRMKRADGSPLWVLMNDRAVKDSKGRTLYYEGMLLDITEQKRTEKNLKATNQKLEKTGHQLREANRQLIANIQRLQAKEKQLIANEKTLHKSEEKLKKLSLLKSAILDSPVGVIVFTLDKHYRYLYFTLSHKQTMKAIWGVDIEIGSNMLDYIKSKPDREKAKRNFDRALKGEYFILYEEYGDEKLKRTFYEDRYSPVYDENNNIIGLSVYVIDITERKQAEKALRESESKYRSIFENATEGIYQSTLQGRFITVNPALVKMFGYKNAEEMLAIEDISRLYWDETERKRLVKLANDTGTLTNVEVKMKRADGSPLWVLMNDRAVKDSKGRTLYYEGTLLDITERKKNEIHNSVINNLLERLSVSLSLKEGAKIISEAAYKLFEYDAFSLDLVDEDQQMLVGIYNEDTPLGKKKPEETSVNSHPLKEIRNKDVLAGRAKLINREKKSLESEYFTFGDPKLISKSLMFAPLLYEGRTVAIISVQSYTTNRYNEKDLEDFQTFAAQAGGSLLRIRAQEALEAQLTFSQALNTLSQQIILEQEPRKLLEAMTRLAGETLGVDRSLIYEIDLQKREARALCQWLSPNADEVPSTADVYPLDLFKESEKQVTTSRHWLESYADRPNPLFIAEGSDKILHGQMQTKSLLWYPFAFRDNTYYLLIFSHVRQFHRWSMQELSFVEALTHQVEMGLLKIRLFEEQKQLAGELRRLAMVVDQASEAVVVTDVKGNITYVNPTFEKLTGYSAEEVLGKNPNILKSGKQEVSFYRELWDTIQRGDIWSGQFSNKRKDGRLYTEQAVIFPVKNPQGEIVNFCKIARDVSRELELEAQLRRSQKLETIGTLAGGIAHDFNNILAPIMGYTELALSSLKETNPLYHDFQQILKAAQRARELVAQILLFAKQSEKEQEPLYLQPLVKEALKLLRPSIPSTIKIEQQIDPACGKVLADATQIHQAIVNLCTNAWQAMEEKGGTLTIELKPVEIDATAAERYPDLAEGEYVCLSVRDTGHGMDQDTLERIFEPFFTTKAVDKGTGLGLSVVHGIVRSHHGDIQVESEPGKGSVFHVYLPVLKKEMEKEETKESAIIGGHESIMVVDDNKTVANLTKRMLESLGYKVEVYHSSVEALKVFHQDPDKFDLILSDLTMPEMTGLDLAKQVQEFQVDFPLIMMTGYGDSLNMDDRINYGIKQVIGKPLSIRDLAEAVRKVLDE